MRPEAPPATHVSDLEVPPRVRPAGTATQHHRFAVVAGLRTGERGRAVFPGIEGTRSHVSNSEVARWIRGTRQWPARCMPRSKLSQLRRRRAVEARIKSQGATPEPQRAKKEPPPTDSESEDEKVDAAAADGSDSSCASARPAVTATRHHRFGVVAAA